MLRRDFLKISSLATTAAMMPEFLRSVPLIHKGKKLLVVQLSGGNDGLNTIVPFRDDAYFRSRPQLAIPANEVGKLTDDMGINPTMTGLRNLYDEGMLTLINSVGYPNPNRSHFRSMDIWHTGSNAEEYWESGWLGRYLDASCTGCAKPHQVLEIDDTLSLAVKGKDAKALAIKDPKRLYQAIQDPYLHSLAQSESQPTGSASIAYLYKTLRETVESVDYIHNNATVYRAKTTFPANPFGQELKLISELIGSGLETTVYYASLTGFDTHVRQRQQHDRLLTQYSEAIKAFVEEMKLQNRMEEVLILTFSEFGRRVEQNAGGGTDHGKANTLWLIGKNLKKPGFYNKTPDLVHLDDGDLAFEIDFRRIYANILQDWLAADASKILQRSFEPLSLLV